MTGTHSEHIPKILEITRGVSGLIVREKNPAQLAKRICELIVQSGHYPVSWMSLLGDSSEVTILEGSGMGGEFQRFINFVKKGNKPYCVHKVLTERDVIVVSEIEKTCGDCPLSLKNISRNMMCVSVMHGDKILGVLAVVITPGNEVSSQEKELFRNIADDIGFALNEIRIARKPGKTEYKQLDIEEKFQRFLNATSDVLYSFDPSSNKYDFIASSFTLLTGYAADEIKAGALGIPREIIHPDDVDRILREVDDVIIRGQGLGPAIFEYRILRKDGAVIWILDRKDIETTADGRICAVNGSIHEITKRKIAEEALSKRDNIFELIRFTAQQSWKTDELDLCVEAALARIGITMEVSRVYIYENHTGAHGAHLTSQRFEWIAQGIKPKAENFTVDNFRWYSGGLRRWHDRLASGRSVYGIADQLPESEKQILQQQDVKSVAAAPIFVGQKWWGFIGLDECGYKRKWSPVEIDTLQVVGGILGSIIERKKAEQALRKSERQYRLLAENLMDVIFTMDMNLNYTYISSSITNMTGYGVEEIKQMPLSETLVPDSYNLVMGTFKEEMDAEQQNNRNLFRARTLVLEEYCKDGSTVWVEVKLSFIRDRNGVPTGILGVSRDISERKKARAALHEREHYYRSLLNNMQEDILVLDKDFRIIDVNDSFLTKTGNKRREVTGLHCFKVSHGYNQSCDQNGNECPLQEVFRNGEPRNCIHKFQISDDKVDWTDVLLSPLKNEHGDVMYVIESVRDISALVRAQEALKTSEGQLKSIVENSLEGIYITQDRVLKFCNQQFANMYAYDSPQDAIGRNIMDFVSPESQALVNREIKARERKQKQVSHYYFKARRADDSRFEVETLGSAIMFDGKPALQGFMRDMSEHRSLEAQLRQSQKMEAVGRLAGGVAHDFNNLLTAIIGNADMALMSLDPNDPMCSDIGEIHQAAQRASDLTRQLLAFSRKQTLEPRVLNLNSII